MANVVTGLGLGVYGSSLTTLGNRGPANDPTIGRYGNQVYVNAATGNLVVSQRDEFIASLGLDLAFNRTYNSLGVLDGDNNDNWRLGVHRKLTNITAGVSITKVYGDGSEAVFNYDSTLGHYVSTQGDGAHDTIRAEGSNWVWHNGNDDITETYDSTGKLLNLKDSDGNTKTFNYTGSLVTGISDSNGQAVTLTYSGNNLQSITTSSSGVVQTRVAYLYDASNRLTCVTVDLTPENTGDAQTFITNYTYDGSSKRIATIDSTGGGAPDLAITYDGSGRVLTLTDGSGNLTRYTYGATSTTVKDPLLRESTYHYDTQGRLTKVESPALTSGGARLVTEYAYDVSGNVTQVKDPTGAIIAFEYDSRGNLERQTDAAGNLVAYTYTADNLLSTETVYLVADPDYSAMGTISNGVLQATDPQTTYYIYDTEKHLRFAITPQGRVTEHRYAADGTRTATLNYTGNTYSISPLQVAPGESTVATWTGAANLAVIERIDYQYDFRGQLSRTTQYQATDTNGAGMTSSASYTYFIYDQRGLLLKSVSPGGITPAETAATAPNAFQHNVNNNETLYIYDGLGRLISQKDALGTLTTHNYDDINNRVSTTFENGLVTISVYSNTGRLIATTSHDSSQVLTDRTAYSLYDAAGQLRVSIDVAGAASYHFYDGAGRRIAAIDPEGLLTEYSYDGAGRLLQKLSYANRVSQALLDQLAIEPAVLEGIAELGQGVTLIATGDFTAVDSTTSNTQTAEFISGLGSQNVDLTVASSYSTTTHVSSSLNNYVWTRSGDSLVQSTGISLAPGTALFDDSSPTEVKATIYRSDGTLYDTVYTTVGATETPQILLNTGAPDQPAGYQASATTDTVSQASQSVTMTVDSTQQYLTYTQTSNVQNFGYTYNSSTHTIQSNGSGFSLGTNSADHNDDSPTLVKADVYKSDGTLVQTVNLVPGNSVPTYWYPPYGAPPVLTGYTWAPATNWNGHVNLGSLSAGNYYVVITTSDSATSSATSNMPGQDYDGTWTRTNTVNFTIGGQIPDHIDTRLSWPNSTTPADTTSITFRYKPTSSSTWTSNTVGLTGSTRYVDFDNIANGTYDYEIVYLDSYGATLKNTAATFTVNGATDSTPAASFLYNTYSSSAATGSSIPAFSMSASEAQSIALIEVKVFLPGTSTQVGSTAVTYPAAHANYFAVSGQYYVNLRAGSILPDGQYDVQITKFYKNNTSGTVTQYMEVGLQPEATNQNYFWNAVDNWSGQVNLKSGSGGMPLDTYRIEIAVRDDASNYGSHNGTQLGSTSAPGADGDGVWTRSNTVYATVGTRYTTLQWSNASQPQGTVVEFVYRLDGSSEFITAPVTLNNGQYSVMLDRLPAGNYEYRMRYLGRDDVVLTVLPSLTLDQLRPGTNVADRLITHVYDNAGRLSQTTLAADAAIVNSYDGASRLTKTEQDGVVTRYFYDNDGRLTGTLDAERFFSRHVYDGAGRLVETVRYDVKVSTALQASGTLAQIETAVQGVPTLKSCYYYDAQGRQVGRVNEQGFLQEIVYDPQHAYREEKQYLTPVTVGAGATLASLKSQAGTAETTRFEFDSLGHLSAKIAADGTQATYRYNQVGQLAETIEAAGTGDARITRTRYNVFGEATGIVSGVGAVSLLWTSAQSTVNTAIDNYGVRYEIDNAGRRIAELHPNGQKTLFYYDGNGRQIYSVNALGEVTAYVYNTFGEVESRTTHNGRISTAGLTGGTDTATVAARVAAVASGANDATSGYAYTTAGRLASMVDAENYATTYGYNSRGQRVDETRTISAGVTVNTHYDRDLLGRLTATIQDHGGLALRTETAYDGFGRINQTRDAGGEYTAYGYTNNGRVITITDGAGRHTKIEYDAYSRILKSYDGFDEPTTYSYDTANRRVTVTTSDGISASTWSTRAGETLKVQDRNGGITEYTYTKDGQLDTVTDAMGVIVTDNTYDNSRRLFETTGGNGSIIRYTYDAANRVIERAVDPSGLNLRTGYQFDGQGRQITVTEGVGTSAEASTQYIYDRKGQIKQIIADPSGLQLSTRFTYNGLGNTLTVEQGTVASPAQKVTHYTYDKAGRKTQEQRDPAGLNITTQYKNDANGRLTRVINASGHSTWYSHDASGNLLQVIDSLGGVTRHYYDDSSRLRETIRFFSTINTAGLGDNSGVVQDPAVHANDVRTLYAHDLHNRVRYILQKVDSANWLVTEKLYDDSGNVIETRGFDQYLSSSSVSAMTDSGSPGAARITTSEVADALAVAGYTGSSFGNTQRSFFVYDANNRARYTLSAIDANNWMATENLYDSRGNVIETRRYDKHINNSSVSSMLGSGSTGGVRIVESEVASALTALGYTGGSFGNTQRSFFAYDADNRLRFTVDALGGVRENAYDARGNITAQTHFAAVPSLGGVYTEAHINSNVNRAHADNQTTQFIYDEADRLKQTIDALNKNEYFEYDALGSKTAYTNKNGAIWNYVYDSVGRLTAEISPAVAIIYGTNTVAESRRLKMAITYDAIGNVISRIEGIVLLNADGSSTDLSVARATSYEYDAVGRQIKTTLPGWYDPATGRVEKDTAAGRFKLFSEVLYDALGNAVRSKIRVASGTSADFIYQYKTYDGLGRLVHDIDALNFVTTNIYQATNLQSILRSANALTALVPGSGYWTVAEVISNLSSNANDRAISFLYDRAGRKAEVLLLPVDGNYTSSLTETSNPTTITTYDGAVATTRYYYNALGQLTAEETKVNQTDWARTFHFYDKLNRETTTVDALGYVTRNIYGTLDNLQQTIEYAMAASMAGASLTEAVLPTLITSVHDRQMLYGYDKLNRLTYIEKSSLYFDSGAPGGFDWEFNEILGNTYDNAGNIIARYDASGLTSTAYDALGRVISVTEPQRVITAASGVDPFKSTVNVSPVTSYTLDVFGNAVKIERGVAGAMNGSTVTTQQKFDYIGNLLEVINVMPGGTDRSTGFDYDVAGRITREYKFATATPATRLTESRYFYDATRRRIATTVVVTDGAGVKQQSGQSAVYNAFGEISQEKRVWGLATVTALSSLSSSVQRSFSYDTMGRVASSQAQDGMTFYYYDLLGNVTREEKRGNESAADGTDTRITETVYDLRGRALLQRLPAYTGIETSLGETTSMLNSKATQAFDRWGNVVSRTDAAGKTTAYVYNHNNQVVRETLPVTLVYKEDGTSYSPTMTHEIHYNTMGLATKEVDKVSEVELRSRSNVYNNVGQLTTAIDATGVQMEYLYDALGSQVATRNELGTVYVDTYNVLGEQIERAVLRQASGSAYNSFGSATPVKVILNTFEYDAAGRRTIERSYLDTDPVTGQTTLIWNFVKSYAYNELGKLTQVNNVGIVTNYKYDAHGNKTEESNELGHTQKWSYGTGDYAFGRLATSWDISNITTAYTYNDFGQLTQESRNGSWQKAYNYHQNGLLKTVGQSFTTGTPGGTVADYSASSISTAYDYDIRGNRVREVHSSSSAWETAVYIYGEVVGVTPSSSSSSFTQLMSYDELGRLSKVKTLPGGTSGSSEGHRGELVELAYQYDEFGNRRQIAASYRKPGQTGTGTEISNTWYAYDKEGRVLIENGTPTTSGGMTYVVGSIKYTYDVAGQRAIEEYFTNTSYTVITYPNAPYDFTPVVTTTTYRSDFETTYAYNDLGLVKAVLREVTHTGDVVGYSSSNATSTYDLRGFKTGEKKYNHSNTLYERTVSSYFGDGRMSSQTVYGNNSSSSIKSETDYSDYDAAGNLEEYLYTVYEDGDEDFHNTYTYDYEIVKGVYKQSEIDVDSTQSGSTTGTTDMLFDAFGNLVYTSVHNGNNQYTYNSFALNNDGQIIFNYETRSNTSTDYLHSHIYVDGNVVGRISNIGLASFVPFDISRKGMQQAATPSQYVVEGGETLQDISQSMYGNGRFWYLIADANGLTYSATQEIPETDAGRPLRIPNIISNKYNDANTFKPYNPAEIIGYLMPTPGPPPPPQAGDKSNGLVAILAVIVTIVVAIYAPYLLPEVTGFWSGVGAAAFGAAMGNIAGQAVNIIGGNQEKFDRDSFRTAVIGGAIGGAFQGPASAATDAGKAGYATLGNAISQQIAVELGYQKEFSWAGVATAAASTGIYENTGDKILTGFASAVIGGRLTAIESGQKTDWAGIAVNAFGQMLGNSIVRGVTVNSATKLDSEFGPPRDFSKYSDKQLDDFISNVKAARSSAVLSPEEQVRQDIVNEVAAMEQEEQLRAGMYEEVTPEDHTRMVMDAEQREMERQESRDAIESEWQAMQDTDWPANQGPRPEVAPAAAFPTSMLGVPDFIGLMDSGNQAINWAGDKVDSLLDFLGIGPDKKLQLMRQKAESMISNSDFNKDKTYPEYVDKYMDIDDMDKYQARGVDAPGKGLPKCNLAAYYLGRYAEIEMPEAPGGYNPIRAGDWYGPSSETLEMLNGMGWVQTDVAEDAWIMVRKSASFNSNYPYHIGPTVEGGKEFYDFKSDEPMQRSPIPGTNVKFWKYKGKQ